jgi:ABC-2 type transport system ATP-binding protein
VGFLGLNGAGKSTTLRMLSCLLLPTSGTIHVDGHDAEEDPDAIRRLVGFLPERPPVYPEMTVRHFLAFAAKLRGVTGARVRERVDSVIEACDLGREANTSVGALSHGYRQRVGIAQAIVHEPRLLILDEPTQGLDPVQIVEMRELIRGLRGQHTILLSTHILSEIEKTCDRILMMHEGRIAASGTEAELAARYGGGRRVEVEASGDAAGLQTLIRALPHVGHVEPLVQGETGARLRVTGKEDVRGAIARAVIEDGRELYTLRPAAGGLESVFVQLNSEHLAAQGGGTGRRAGEAA